MPIIKTSLIDAVNIVTGTLVAGVISTTNITTGKITITNNANIGGWKVKDNSLVIEGESTAKLAVEPNGGRFLRINSTKDGPMLDVRADAGTGINIYTQQKEGTCISAINQAGGYAMKITGSCYFNQRSGEKWSAPGVLLAGRVSASGGLENKWGNGNGDLVVTTGRTTIGGRFSVNHNIGHTEYYVSILTLNRVVAYIVNKYNNYFEVQLDNTGGGGYWGAFEFIIVGRPRLM